MQTITTAYEIRRMRSSENGNPRFELRCAGGGNIIGTTRPNSGIAYGEVQAYAGRGTVCRIDVHETPSGRRYVEAVRRC